MTDYTLLSDHLQEVLFGIRDVVCIAMCTRDYPLCLRRSLPQKTKGCVCSFRGSGILRIPPILGCRCDLLDNWQKPELDVLDFVQYNVGQSAGTAQAVRGLEAEIHIHQRA